MKKPFDINRGYEILFREWGPQHWWPGEGQVEIVVGALLAQSTNWRNAAKAVEHLKQAGLLEDSKESFGRLVRIPADELEGLIKPSGYFRQKAARLKRLTGFLAQTSGTPPWAIPETETLDWREKLLQINGLGPETVDSILLYGFGLPCFVVDAYTLRILVRHGMCSGKTTYEDIRSMFERELPERSEVYNEYHALIVRLGKEHCRSNPRCSGCPLA
ncbi:endonuclease III domain-containing protein [candidate division WOR-3 bacterium]|uniref:Endonuclease III domain-containing protein n=1 Tax=candidate division WOR-3 bacterium TaxID=2052148 RepID=A0A9D5QDI1_UNCW3|nr:endonuclease III domain-containing protein [candidate division WOR-3 bacterium]MBD3365669.1 endonuclease III domain-containing protein [candidate division WOR-3 bacterium]